MSSIACLVKKGVVVAASFLLLFRPLAAHEGHSHGAATAPVAAPPSRPDVRVQNPSLQMPPPITPAQSGPPHGGQVKAGWQHVVEVVYLPQQIQIYLYDRQGQALSPQSVAGDVAMEVNGNPRQWWYRLELAPAGDHLVINVDLSRIRDRDMVAVFELKNLPNREEPQVRFAQLFALSQANSRVQTIPLAAGDREAAARQRVCPVTGDGFNHGDPIKLLVDGRAVFVCCESCIEGVKKEPEKFASSTRLDSLRLVRQAAETPGGKKGTALPANMVALYGARPGVTAVPATAADQRWVAEQRVCPVTKQPLGSMGVPWRVTVEGQTIYVCCQACVQEIEKDPLFYVRPPAPDFGGGGSKSGCSSSGCSNCRAR